MASPEGLADSLHMARIIVHGLHHLPTIFPLRCKDMANISIKQHYTDYIEPF